MAEFELLMYGILPKMLLAILCGSLIGLERELKDKPAGIRTYMLICTGATFFTIIGDYYSSLLPAGVGDPMRIASQIVVGIGFLGAGTIIFARGYVRGLTSAAAIWVSAAIGMGIGVGLYMTSVIITVMIVAALVALGQIEQRMGLKGHKRYRFVITLKSEAVGSARQVIYDMGHNVLRQELVPKGEESQLTVECEMTRAEEQRFQKGLSQVQGLVSMQQCTE